MKTIGAALAGALITGILMFAIGTRAADDSLAGRGTIATAPPMMVGQVPAGYVVAQPGAVLVAQPAYILQLAAQPAMYMQPAPAQPVVYTEPAPVARRVARPQVVRERVVASDRVIEAREPQRSWGKTALVIGGSSAAGAGVGAITGGKKGALIGAAIGGGAASIFEAVKRR